MDQYFTVIDSDDECYKCDTDLSIHGPYFTHKIGDRTITLCESCNKDFEVWLERNYFENFCDIVSRDGNWRN